MRVLCIHSGTPGKTHDNRGNKGVYVPSIFIGNYYNTVNEWTQNGKTYYELAEIPPDKDGCLFGYASVLFAMPSEIDETELINHKEEVV